MLTLIAILLFLILAVLILMTGAWRAMVGMGLPLLLFLYVGASQLVNFRHYKHHVTNRTGSLQLALWRGAQCSA